ncbi:zona pellucida sperm-binding protein 1 [Oryzias latipes]|uniref:Zona pellucida sperm-binding protein 4-like n=1 Tax=Oryzias latipes TaxID=8090 RepID=H2MIV9_ORYLA|nr:zona pellucida sperm-binding protein 1 [Oryzias latipes]
MNCCSVKLCLVSLLSALAAQMCGCSSDIQRRRSSERTHLALPTVTCSEKGMRAAFGPLVKDNLRVRDPAGPLHPVLGSDGSCGVKLRNNQSLSFFGRYDSCYARVEGSKVMFSLLVQLTGEDQWIRVNISCPLIKRSKSRVDPTPFPGECIVEKSLQIQCGHQVIKEDACTKLGCCYNTRTASCYYRLNACSLDGHFVFTVKAADTHPPIDPSTLVIKDQPQCLPTITTSDVAVFKIGVQDCGAKMKMDGDLVIYEVEVEELPPKSKSRPSPFSLQVECEYEESDLIRAKDLRSFYTVTNPPPVVAQGTIKVQMRIATDSSFTAFIPEDQLPLTVPLRKAVNVEISIAQPSPDPTLFLRVRDCFAYPTSKHSVWTLLHDGCPNPLDNLGSSVPVDEQGRTASHSQVRRFDVKTFAFMDPNTGHPSSEEMYFYCWVEICTDDVECAQRCTLISSEGERQRRQTKLFTHQLQLVSFGPLLQSGTETDTITLFHGWLYLLPAVGAALVLVLLIVWLKFRCQKTEGQQTYDVHSEQAQ